MRGLGVVIGGGIVGALVGAVVWNVGGFGAASRQNGTPPDVPASSATRQIAATSAPPGFSPVIRVIDGDTLIVDYDGATTTIRLIGADTPETVDPRKPVECYGPEASAEAHKLLDDQSVRLQFDPSQGTLDKYGRTLAYVYLQDGTLYDEFMIANGFAHEYTYNTPYEYQAEFKAAQAEAQKEELGFWSPSTCDGDVGVTSHEPVH